MVGRGHESVRCKAFSHQSAFDDVTDVTAQQQAESGRRNADDTGTVIAQVGEATGRVQDVEFQVACRPIKRRMALLPARAAGQGPVPLSVPALATLYSSTVSERRVQPVTYLLWNSIHGFFKN